MEVNAIGPLLRKDGNGSCALSLSFRHNTEQNSWQGKTATSAGEGPRAIGKSSVLAAPRALPRAPRGASQLSGPFSASLEWMMYMKVCSMVKSGGRLPLCTPTCLLMRLRVEL